MDKRNSRKQTTAKSTIKLATPRAGSVEELAELVSKVLNHPLTKTLAPLYNAIGDEVTPLRVPERDLGKTFYAPEIDSVPHVRRALRQRLAAIKRGQVSVWRSGGGDVSFDYAPEARGLKRG